MPCPTCIELDCQTIPDIDLYNFQSGLIFTNGTLSFVMACPAGYVCAPGGNYPITIVIPPGRIRLPVPPTRFPTEFAIVLSLRCCQSTLSRTIPVGTTQAQITAISNAMILECAAQQAACDVITTPPGPGLPPPIPENPPGGSQNTRIDLRNAPQTASKACGAGMTGSISVTIGSGRFGAILWNPTAAQVAAMQATLNSWALSTAQDQVDAITPPSIINATPLPSGAIGVAYSEDLDGTGGDPPYTFSIASGSLPNGLSLNSSTGLISGTPTVNGDSTFVVSITDSDGHACSKEFELTIGALCPVFIANKTDGTMVLPEMAVAASDLTRVLVASDAGNLQIIETIAGVDTVIATNTYLPSQSLPGVYVPSVSKFFINGAVGVDTEVLKINPTTGATEGATSIDNISVLGYNSARDSVFLMGFQGLDWGVMEMDPVSMSTNIEYISTNGSSGYAFYFGSANAIVVLKEPANSSLTFLNAGNYALVDTLDITIAFGGGDNTDQFDTAAVACAGKMFVGFATELSVFPFTRIAVKLAVISAGATAITAIDLTSLTLSNIEWMQANESLGVVIVKAAGKVIVVDANTFQIICSFNTTSTAGEFFCVQPANSRIYIPRRGSNDVSIYGQ